MKKLLLTIFAIMTMAVSASARSLVIELTNGDKIYYLIGGETNPVLTFNEGTVSVDGAQYTFANVAKFYISETDDPNAIEGVSTKPEAAIKEGMVYVQTKGQVQLFSTDGRQMNVRTSRQGKSTVVDATQLPAGSYILRVGNQSVKFLKK